jgi:hypothetical protein
LDAAAIGRAVADQQPEPLHAHYVVIGGKRFPPKQVISAVTGLDRADFTTHQARRILRRLGFAVGRRGDSPPRQTDDARRDWPHGGREADLLRPYMGRWVAQRGLEVVVAADTPEEVASWLVAHDVKADSMFRVPVDERGMQGAGPD